MKSSEMFNEFTEDALNSLDGLERATPAPYLLTRINQKLDTQPTTSWEKLTWFIGKPAIAFPALILILIMNVMAIVNQDSLPASVVEQTATLPGDEYSISVATIYDSENP